MKAKIIINYKISYLILTYMSNSIICIQRYKYAKTIHKLITINFITSNLELKFITTL